MILTITEAARTTIESFTCPARWATAVRGGHGLRTQPKFLKIYRKQGSKVDLSPFISGKASEIEGGEMPRGRGGQEVMDWMTRKYA